MDPSQNERRRRPRHRTLLGGKICYGRDYALSLDCTVRGLSEGGASLRVQAAQALPAEFVLLVVPEGVAYDARLEWRRADFAGVSLGEPISMRSPEVEGRLRAVRRLWAALAPL